MPKFMKYWLPVKSWRWRSRMSSVPDELQRPLGASAAGLLDRDQHVHVRILTVPDVVDEGDFLLQVVVIAMVAVQKDFDRGRFGRGCLLRECRDGEEKQGQETALCRR